MNIHKKYIKKDGKTFGPYYYHSYRVGDKIKTKYLGSSPPQELGDSNENGSSSEFSPMKVFSVLIVAGLLLFALSDSGNRKFAQDQISYIGLGMKITANAILGPQVRSEAFAEAQVSSCMSDWECDSWSLCENSVQTRLCVDNNNCGSGSLQPLYNRSCIPK